MTTAPVMLGVDAVAGSLDALTWALGECRTRAVDLVLVHALDRALDRAAARNGDAPTTAEIADEVLRVHGTVAEQVAPDVVVRSRVIDSPTADALIDASQGASLIVLGSRGRSGFTESAFGSVAHRVAVHAHSPVVVVPRHPTRPLGSRPRRIVVGVAGTRAGRQAIDFAVKQAQRSAATLVLVRCSEEREAAVAAQETVRADLRLRYPDVRVELVVTNSDPIAALVDEDLHADLVVLGCHHSDDPWNARLGGVPVGVLAQTHCPVALVGQLPVARMTLRESVESVR